MHEFIILLLTCSAVMSVIALVYMVINPFLAKFCDEKWRYYLWLIILIGLMIPFRPQWNNALISITFPNENAYTMMQMGQTTSTLPTIHFPLTIETISNTTITQNTPFDWAWAWAWAWAWWQLVFTIWVMGLIIFIVFQLVNHYFFIKKVKRWSKTITDEKSNILFNNLKQSMGIKRPIRLMMCDGIGSPTMVGFIKPTILLPIADFTQDELFFILKHELVHYKRGDLFYKGFLLIVTAMHWFNPMIYIVAKAISNQCELSCDAEIVLHANEATRQQYSETIISVVRYQSRFKTALSTTFYGGKKGMKNRITVIMTTHKKAAVGSITAVLALVCVLTLGTLTAFSAQHSPTNRPLQHIGTRTESGIVFTPAWEANLADVRFYELDQVTPFDFSRSIEERLANGGPIFRFDSAGNLSEWDESEISRLFANKDLPMRWVTEASGRLMDEAMRESLQAQLQFIPITEKIGSSTYDLMRMRGKTPILDADDNILMWVNQSFFEMTYEEFNALAEQLLTTAVIIQTQETVDILRAAWIAAQ